MCDHQEKGYKHDKTPNSKSQQGMQPHHNQGHRHHHCHHQEDGNKDKNVHSAEDIRDRQVQPNIQNQRDHDKTHHHPHHYRHKQNYCHVSRSTSTSSLSSSSSTSSSSSSSSLSSSSFSSSLSSSSSTMSSSSSSLSSKNSSECSDRYYPRRPQHSQSFTDISERHKYFEDDDDTAPLISARGDLNRSSAKQKKDVGKSSPNGPNNEGIKEKHMRSRHQGNDGSFRKAKSMNDLTTPKDKSENGNENGDEQEISKSEVKHSLVKEKMKFSAFLNEITRQVLSPMRLSSLGVTDTQRPHSPGQASVKSMEKDSNSDKPKRCRSQPASPDSISSSKHSYSSQLSRSKTFNHHGRHSASPPSHMTHRSKSCHSRSPSPEHHPNLTSRKLSCHHHQKESNNPSHHRQHRKKRTTSRHHHHRHHHNPAYQQKDHHSPTYYSASHRHRDKHHKDHYSPSHYDKHHSESHGHDHHAHSQEYHHGTHHEHAHNLIDNYDPSRHHEDHLVLSHHLEDHHNSGHHHNVHPISCPTTPCPYEHCSPISNHGIHQGIEHQHHHGDHHRDTHHHRDTDHMNESHHLLHDIHHSLGHHQHHNETHGHHYEDHPKESNHPHCRDHHSPINLNPSQHHHNKPQHLLENHHSQGHLHHHPYGAQHNEACHHGNHHSKSHKHKDQHSDPQHHCRDLHRPAHHHRNQHNNPHHHHHGDHHNPGHHYHNKAYQHHQDQPNEVHHHHQGDQHSEVHHYKNHYSQGHNFHQEDDKRTGHCQDCHLDSLFHVKCCKTTSCENNRLVDDPINLTDHSTINQPSHTKPESLVSKNLTNNTNTNTSSSTHEEETHEFGRIMTLQDQNEGLHHSLLKTAVQVECLGEEFISSQKLLETELQRTRIELSSLMEKFKSLQDDCSSTQQTNNLLEQKLNSMLQNMEGERERLNRRVSELTEQLTDAKIANTMEAINTTSVIHKTSLHSSDDAIMKMVPSVTPPPAQFVDNHNYEKDQTSGQEQPLGCVPEEEESDWSEVGEETPRLRLTGSSRGQTWRTHEADMDKDSESGSEEILRRCSPCPLQIPHLQFTIHNEFLPPAHTSSCPSGFKNLSDSIACDIEEIYMTTTSPTLKSAILIRSASLEEIPLTRHHMQKELRGTEAMMNLHQSANEAMEGLNKEIIHHWRMSSDRDTVIRRLPKSGVAEADGSMAGLHSAERMINHFICDPPANEAGDLGRAEVHGWAGGIQCKVLNVERTQL